MTGEYITDPATEHGLDFVENLDGVWWFDAPAPPRRHKCWAQSRGLVNASPFARCACGAISMDRPYEVKASGRYWMERNQRIRDGQDDIVERDNSWLIPHAPGLIARNKWTIRYVLIALVVIMALASVVPANLQPVMMLVDMVIGAGAALAGVDKDYR